MKGRIEQKIKTENQIVEFLKDKPLILQSYSHTFNDKTFNTKSKYLHNVNNFLIFMKNEFNIDTTDFNAFKLINVMHINQYLECLKYIDGDFSKENSVGYINSTFYSIKDFFNFLESCQYVTQNPCSKVKLAKDKTQKSITYLTEDEIKIIQRNIKYGVGTDRTVAYNKKWQSRDLCIIYIGISTGLRVSAIRNINISDIDFNNKTILTVEKGGFEREIYVPDNVINAIKKCIKDRNNIVSDPNMEPLFVSSQGCRISTETIRRLIHKYTYNIDKNITPHKMRSTAASNLYKATGDIYLVADVLGHHNIQNTKRYAEIPESNKIKAANILGNML